MNIFLFLSCVFFLTGCGKSCSNHTHVLNQKVELANEIRNKVAIQLEKETGLHPCGTGGQMMNQIEMLALSFDYYKPVEIEEARELLLIATDTFLKAVNEDVRIRPYLVYYPFRSENIQIRIFVQKSDFSSFGSEKLIVVSMIDGVLKYNIDNPENKLFTTIHSETYAEAAREIARKKELVNVKEAAWRDLRIQSLLPNFLTFPAVEPCLPENFVAIEAPHNGKMYGTFWGPKDVLENYFKSEGVVGPKWPIIKVDVSPNVAQKDENGFVDEAMFEKQLVAQGAQNVVLKKSKWGSHPVLSCSATMLGNKLRFAWIGLNNGGITLLAALINPKGHDSPSPEGEQLWSDFLTKTKPLNEHDFIKAHGQDLREGLTLVNLNGAVLKVYAEKRIRDGQIQVVVKPVDGQLVCKCLAASQGVMGLSWHRNEPLVKMEVELKATGKANIIKNSCISVLLKNVDEFSFGEDSSPEMIGPVSLVNFCKPAA